MFNNPDFKGWPNALMFLAMVSLYDVVYAFSNVIGISWVDISSYARGPYQMSRNETGYTGMFFFFICFGVAVAASLRRAFTRVKLKEVLPELAKKAYLKSLGEFCVVFVLLIIILPIITPYLRGWK